MNFDQTSFILGMILGCIAGIIGAISGVKKVLKEKGLL